MSLRFTSQLNIDNLPDEQLNNQFEVIMPTLDIKFNEVGPNPYQFAPGTSVQQTPPPSSFGIWYSYTPIVEEIVFGTRNYKTDTRRVRTGWFNVPSDIDQYKEVKITMFCPASMVTQYYLEAWKKLIFNDEGEYYYPFTWYKKNIEVFIYGPTGNVGSILGVMPECHFTLQGCFPKLQEEYTLQYTEDPKRFRILATFSIDNIRIDNSVANKALNRELLTSPASILDRGLSSLNSSKSSAYDINNTYSTAQRKVGN